jgi:hypothetical protein
MFSTGNDKRRRREPASQPGALTRQCQSEFVEVQKEGLREAAGTLSKHYPFPSHCVGSTSVPNFQIDNLVRCPKIVKTLHPHHAKTAATD